MRSKNCHLKRVPVLHWAFFFSMFLIVGSGVFADEPLKVYYLRHAEGGHNVVEEWKSKPKEQRPPYVGNPDMFTPKGQKQVVEVTKKLEGTKIDFIAVSPTWRTRNTVLPYLKIRNLKAEIWPELMETPSIGSSIPKDLPSPSAKFLEGIGPLKIPKEEEAFFTLRDDGRNELKFGAGSSAQSSADAIALAEKTVQMIKMRFGKSGKTLLLVGHGLAGTTLIAMLTGATVPQYCLGNTKLWMAEEQPDGSFKLKMLNNEPYESK